MHPNLMPLRIRASLAVAALLAAVITAPVAAAPVPFDYAVRARSTLSTGSITPNPRVDDVTHFDGATSASASDSFTDGSSGRDFHLDGGANLASSTLSVRNRGTGGPGASQSNTVTFLFAELLDTLTFTGDYTVTPLRLPFTATFDGTWVASGLVGDPHGDPAAQIFTWLWFADGSLAFTQDDWLNTGALFANSGRLRGDVTQVSVADNGATPIHVVYHDTLELWGVDPLLRAWMGLEADVGNFNATAAWDANLAHTATLTFDFTGLDVHSASGVFPGTSATVPEPGALSLFALAFATAAWRRYRGNAVPPV
ncbi:MAG: PEP-CTERM sorting domain-containing protein [Proteobacteria bacterium]|nr:PEP-CTERM sorting domain-containing protein [Pseudomonadota bacterium]